MLKSELQQKTIKSFPELKAGEYRYFLAIIPPLELCDKIDSIKQEFADAYGCKAAFRSPPHITFHMPFQWREAKEARLFEALRSAGPFEPFTITLNGFGAFEPRTIFIEPEPCPPLMKMNESLLQATKRKLHLFHAVHAGGFHPHITVAFRDLKKAHFTEAWPVYASRVFKDEFDVKSFWLLKHNGSRWLPYEEFSF
ncbi:2'-5' RNA ligase [Roseivirga thermotolerans]|uniref:2'-5' RNA ligase n=1 Tax=Roseivirga thermotolerans TaxID=1758176 RepID=A0ABQ3I596_9BACT|nr:2'-5' RNA ligase [Roseivirga thermotolerans]